MYIIYTACLLHCCFISAELDKLCFQLFALLQSLSLRWTWPIEWTRNFSFVFIFNLDFWELAKLATENAYIPARDYLVPSAAIPINFRLVHLN